MTKPNISDDAGIDFDLSDFLPYQARLFYKAISQAIADVYIDEYGMKPYEWRILAILGASQSYTPAELARRSSMDKVSVSRALASLSERGWITSRSNKNDGRSRLVRSSAKGRKIFEDLVPKIRQVDQQTLSHLTPQELSELKRLMQKVVDGSAQVIDAR